jgi:hypothetical protein
VRCTVRFATLSYEANRKMKITPNSLTISQLFSSTNEQFVVPAYQRRYSWRERQIWELIEDIDLIEGADTHLWEHCLSDRAPYGGIKQT